MIGVNLNVRISLKNSISRTMRYRRFCEFVESGSGAQCVVRIWHHVESSPLCVTFSYTVNGKTSVITYSISRYRRNAPRRSRLPLANTFRHRLSFFIATPASFVRFLKSLFPYFSPCIGVGTEICFLFH